MNGLVPHTIRRLGVGGGGHIWGTGKDDQGGNYRRWDTPIRQKKTKGPWGCRPTGSNLKSGQLWAFGFNRGKSSNLFMELALRN